VQQRLGSFFMDGRQQSVIEGSAERQRHQGWPAGQVRKLCARRDSVSFPRATLCCAPPHAHRAVTRSDGEWDPGCIFGLG